MAWKKVDQMTTHNMSAKRKAMEGAATELFLDLGYDATTMEAIAKRARVSKATLYAHYRRKEVLFLSVIKSVCLVPDEISLNSVSPVDSETALTGIATNLLENMVSPRTLALVRTVFSVMPRLPQLGEALHYCAVTSKQRMVADVIRQLVSAGKLSIADTDQAADVFLSLLRGNHYFGRLFGVTELGCDDQKVAEVVSLFLKAYAA